MISSRLLTPASEISTDFRCDNCGISIDKVSWKQCNICKAFDLCDKCANEYDELPPQTHHNHQILHPNAQVNNDCMKLVLVQKAETDISQARIKRTEQEYERIVNEAKIKNDYDMNVVMNKLKKSTLKSISSSKEHVLESMVLEYHLKINQPNIRVLSLDGGGVRGYMPIKILDEFIHKKYLPNIEKLNPDDLKHNELFHEAQLKFTKQFDYFVGTGTSGLTAFCLAINYNIMDIKEIYTDTSHYFKRNFFGPLICSKYDPSVIHEKIDDIIDSITFPGNKITSAKNATLLDIRNLLNPDNIIDEAIAESIISKRGNSLEFIDKNKFTKTFDGTDEENYLFRVKHEKILLITACNTTCTKFTIFNTSDSKHWGYLIADVLKAAMAVPTCFPPHKVYKGEKQNGFFKPGKMPEVFIDGGIFVNDPELAVLLGIGIQWEKPLNYHFLSVGTGCYASELSGPAWGSYFSWLFNGEYLVNTLMDATRGFTESIRGNFALFYTMKRMKLNYKITKPMGLDDSDFVRIFDQEWEYLKNEADFNALVYFYNTYIVHND